MTLNTTTQTLPALDTLISLCLELHTRLTFDTVPFSLITFARDMHESHMLLVDADLTVYAPLLIDAMTAHTHRSISRVLAEKIVRHLIVMQDMVRRGQTL